MFASVYGMSVEGLKARLVKVEVDIANGLPAFELERNTANLNEIISLLKNSNKKQEEIFDVIVKILEIAKEKDKEKAQNKYRKVMSKITNLTNDVKTMTTLYSFGTTIYNIFHANNIL